MGRRGDWFNVFYFWYAFSSVGVRSALPLDPLGQNVQLQGRFRVLLVARNQTRLDIDRRLTGAQRLPHHFVRLLCTALPNLQRQAATVQHRPGVQLAFGGHCGSGGEQRDTVDGDVGGENGHLDVHLIDVEIVAGVDERCLACASNGDHLVRLDVVEDLGLRKERRDGRLEFRRLDRSAAENYLGVRERRTNTHCGLLLFFVFT